MSEKKYKKLIEKLEDYIDYIKNYFINEIIKNIIDADIYIIDNLDISLAEKNNKKDEVLVIIRNKYEKLLKPQVDKLSNSIDNLKYNINKDEIKKIIKLIKILNNNIINKVIISTISLDEISSMSTISSSTNSLEITINSNIIEYKEKTNRILLNIDNYIIDEPLDSEYYSESEPTLSEIKEEYKNFIKYIRTFSIFITKNKEYILNYLQNIENNHITTLNLSYNEKKEMKNKIQEEKLRRYQVLNKYKVFYSNMINTLKQLKLYKSKESIDDIITKLYELHRNEDNFYVINIFFSGYEFNNLNYNTIYKNIMKELKILIDKFISKKSKLLENLENYKKSYIEERKKSVYTFVDKPLTIKSRKTKKTALRKLK